MTSECIDSVIEKTEGLDYEIIVIDNASSDDSKISFEKDKRIKYIYLNKNIGFGRANNTGIKVSKGRNILFLNSDTLLINNAIKILSDFLDNNKDVVACGGNLYNAEMRPTHSFYKYFNPIFIELDRLSRETLRRIVFGKNFEFNFSDAPISVSYICGADLMVKADILKKLDGFSPAFFMYYEETDLCYRIRKCKYKIMSVPQARIQHLEGGSMKKDNNRIYKSWSMISHSRKIFNSRHYSSLNIKISENIMKFNFWISGSLNKKKRNHYKKMIHLYKEA